MPGVASPKGSHPNVPTLSLSAAGASLNHFATIFAPDTPKGAPDASRLVRVVLAHACRTCATGSASSFGAFLRRRLVVIGTARRFTPGPAETMDQDFVPFPRPDRQGHASRGAICARRNGRSDQLAEYPRPGDLVMGAVELKPGEAPRDAIEKLNLKANLALGGKHVCACPWEPRTTVLAQWVRGGC